VAPKIQEALPKYVQVANHFRNLILRGELRPGDEIPSERRIVDDWGVSRPTATKALALLRQEGLVESQQGSGTYVRSRPGPHRRAPDRYARERRTGKVYPPNERAEIVEATSRSAPEHVATALGLEPGAETLARRRIIHDDTGPVEVSTSWFDPDVGSAAPRLATPERIREGTVAYIEQTTGRRAYSAADRISARLATERESRELQLDEPIAAVLIVHHTVYDQHGQPLEFAEAAYPPGRWMFEDHYPLPES
jgi:GntR family transcriptional regulator